MLRAWLKFKFGFGFGPFGKGPNKLSEGEGERCAELEVPRKSVEVV